MEKESAYVRRWELIEPRVSFQEIGERLLAGENIEHFVIPGLRGERIAIKITKANVRSAERGTILGHIEGQPSSYVALTFVNGKQTGVVQMRGQKTHEIAYTPYGAGRIIIKEVDLVARARKTEMQMAAYHFSYSVRIARIARIQVRRGGSKPGWSRRPVINNASSAESVGRFGLGKVAKCVK